MKWHSIHLDSTHFTLQLLFPAFIMWKTPLKSEREEFQPGVVFTWTDLARVGFTDSIASCFASLWPAESSVRSRRVYSDLAVMSKRRFLWEAKQGLDFHLIPQSQQSANNFTWLDPVFFLSTHPLSHQLFSSKQQNLDTPNHHTSKEASFYQTDIRKPHPSSVLFFIWASLKHFLQTNLMWILSCD